MKKRKRLHFGVIFSTLDDANQNAIWNGVAEYAKRNDIHLTAYFGTYQMTISDSASHFETCFETVRNSVSIDGLIMFSGYIAHMVGNEKLNEYIARIPKHVPLVSISYIIPGVPSIIIDNVAGMYNAVSHLIQAHGKRRIAFAKGPDGHPEAEARLEGYKKALAANGIEYDDKLVFHGKFDKESGRAVVRSILETPGCGVDAIAASNDVAVVGVLNEMREYNLIAPADFAVTGFDDDKVSASYIPSISTVKQDFHKFGLISAEMVHDRIRGKAVEPVTYVSPEFIARQSCGCLEKEFLNAGIEFEGGAGAPDALAPFVARGFASLFKRDVPEPLIGEWAADLTSALKQKPFSADGFLNLLNVRLIGYNYYSSNIILWYEALNILSRGAELFAEETAGAAEIRSTLSYAETLVHGMRGKEREFKEIALNDSRWMVRRVASNLVLIFDIDTLADELFKSLPDIDIEFVIVGLYHSPIKSGEQDANRSLDTVFGFEGDNRFYIKGGGGKPIEFSDYSSIKYFDYDRERRDLFFIPLFFKNEEYGVMLMPFDPAIAVDTYETLRVNISTAVKGAELIREISYQNNLLNAVNDAAAILFDPGGEKLEENVLGAMGDVARAMRVSRMYIWKNYGDGCEKGAEMIYEWRASGVLKNTKGKKAGLRYADGFWAWERALSAGECINNFVRERPPSEQSFLSELNIVSIVVAPVVINNRFWGFVGFDDHLKERRFTENEEMILRSVGILIANALLRQEMSRDLQSTLERATEASKAKSNFLSSMSHEIRTPMNAIIGMTNVGKKAKDSEEKDYALEKIGDASSHLLGVINDILDMSKIEANKLELAPVEFNFERMLQKAISIVNFRVDEKEQKLFVNIDKNIPHFVIGDDQRLAQVITNLLSNAVKFTHPGGIIHLKASLANKTDKYCELRIEVSDNGIGISPEKQERLFNAFEQAETGISREYGGTGLGLVISRRIVELMDGAIWIDSDLGRGATFTFTVKMRLGEKSPRTLLAPGVSWGNVRVLAVDDDSETRAQFLDIFGELGVICDVAYDGMDARNLIAKRGDYDLYFVDWRMPRMDGIELTRFIKARAEEHASVVIMMTAMDWNQIKNEAAAAGVDRHLFKPFFTSTIIDCLNYCFGADRGREDEIHNIESLFAGKKMLLAEDIEINREIFMSLLEDTGIEIDCAENGQEAVDKIAAAPGKYDIVLMDVQMPKMDGYEAARAIRALSCERDAHLPIIAMTANVFRSDIENSLAAGMDDHLGKPLDIEKVLEVLRKYI